MELTAEQVRVLGCLLEKEATTPDQYPLSTNALTLACNQKNNRDPVVAYSERQVDQVMLELRQAGLARTVHAAGARVPKHRHVLDEAWGLSGHDRAVLAVLALRGPNTVHELAVRTQRYGGPPGEDTLAAVLSDLARREPPLVVELGRQPGQRETRWSHLLWAPGHVPVLAASAAPPGVAVPTSLLTTDPAPEPGALARRVETLEARVAALEDRLRDLSGG